MKNLYCRLQELKALYINGIVTREGLFRELDELIRYASDKNEIDLVNKFKKGLNNEGDY